MKKQLALTALVMALPGAASAGLEVCNQTSDEQSIAIGYQQDGQWISEGWWNIPAGDCKEPVKGDLKTRYYYLHASAAGRTYNGQGYSFCTQSDVFTIVGDENCAARGYDSTDFSQIDTGKTATHHTHTILEAAQKQDSGQKQQAAAQPSAQARSGSGLVRGQHGEPYTDQLMFHSCDVFDGNEACKFIGDGWRFFAYYDDPTPSSYLRQFEGVPPNTPMQVTGDLMSYADRTVHLAITDMEPLWGQDPYAHINAALQGDWVSGEEGGEESLFIFGSEMHSYHDSVYSDTYFLNIKPNCPDSAGAGPVMVQTSLIYGDTNCYLIDNYEGGWLDLILMGHEALISYRKVN